jgi:hypothetical protein
MPLNRRFGQREQIPYWEDSGVVDDGLTELEAYQRYMSTRMPDPEDDPDLGVDSRADLDALSPEDKAYILQGEMDPKTFNYILELVDPHLTLD